MEGKIVRLQLSPVPVIFSLVIPHPHKKQLEYFVSYVAKISDINFHKYDPQMYNVTVTMGVFSH